MSATPRQLPLDLGHAPGSSRDDLIVSPANASAVALIDAWPRWPGPVVLLAGPAGSGKSHLAAIWRERAGAEAVDGHGIDGAAMERAGQRPVLLEDADRGGLDESGLFHLVNAVRGAGSFLLITARRLPGAWDIALPDLASRLKAAATVGISEPDDALLAGVITKLFADRQVAVERHVVDYLVRRIERSLAAAIAVVEALDRAALERKTRVTRALAAEIVAESDTRQGDLEF